MDGEIVSNGEQILPESGLGDLVTPPAAGLLHEYLQLVRHLPLTLGQRGCNHLQVRLAQRKHPIRGLLPPFLEARRAEAPRRRQQMPLGVLLPRQLVQGHELGHRHIPLSLPQPDRDHLILPGLDFLGRVGRLGEVHDGLGVAGQLGLPRAELTVYGTPPFAEPLKDQLGPHLLPQKEVGSPVGPPVVALHHLQGRDGGIPRLVHVLIASVGVEPIILYHVSPQSAHRPGQLLQLRGSHAIDEEGCIHRFGIPISGTVRLRVGLGADLLDLSRLLTLLSCVLDGLLLGGLGGGLGTAGLVFPLHRGLQGLKPLDDRLVILPKIRVQITHPAILTDLLAVQCLQSRTQLFERLGKFDVRLSGPLSGELLLAGGIDQLQEGTNLILQRVGHVLVVLLLTRMQDPLGHLGRVGLDPVLVLLDLLPFAVVLDPTGHVGGVLLLHLVHDSLSLPRNDLHGLGFLPLPRLLLGSGNLPFHDPNTVQGLLGLGAVRLVPELLFVVELSQLMPLVLQVGKNIQQFVVAVERLLLYP